MARNFNSIGVSITTEQLWKDTGEALWEGTFDYNTPPIPRVGDEVSFISNSANLGSEAYQMKVTRVVYGYSHAQANSGKTLPDVSVVIFIGV